MTRLDFKLKTIDNGSIQLAAFIGKTDTTVRNYREGKSQPPLDIAIKIAEFLSLPVTELFDEVDSNGQKVEQEKLATA